MTLLEIIILAVVQGLTEFLPVSSSGHLAIMQTLFERWKGFATENATLDILLHFGTLLATLLYFRREVAGLVRGFFGSRKSEGSLFGGSERKVVGLIVVSLIPTGIFGLLLGPLFEEMLHNILLVGIMLGLTALVIFSSRFRTPSKRFQDLSFLDALLIGTAQGLAIFPGLSRSGMTIASAMLLGWEREEAFKFSFLISMPAILGATLLELKKIDFTNTSLMGGYVSGMILAGIIGYLTLILLRNMIVVRKFHYFSFYCLGIALFAMILYFA